MKNIYFLILIALAASCTVEKTPFGNRLNFVSRGALQEVAQVKKNEHLISIESSGGEFLRGYNALAVKITTANTFEKLNVEKVTLSVTRTDIKGKPSYIPYSKVLDNSEDSRIFKGFVVFDTPKKYSVLNATHTGIKTPWHLSLTYTIEGREYQAEKEITVWDTRNYTVANNYLLELDPRMPGEDMGNHSSPDNQDLTQGTDGFYHGKVNYTMSGYWTLNFILKDTQKRVIKGTEVPDTVKMGVFGEQSELHIDILF